MENALVCRWDVGTTPTDVAWHPKERLLACGTMDGEVCLYRRNDNTTAPTDDATVDVGDTSSEEEDVVRRGRIVINVPRDGGDLNDARREVVRAVGFAGDMLCAGTAGGDVCLLDPIREHHVGTLSCDHREGVHRVLGVDDGGLVCTGSDGGVVALWDVRESNTRGPVHTIHPHTDYVSDMVFVQHKHALLTVSGDGTLCMSDVRMQGTRPSLKLKHRSEDDADDELVSVCVVRQGEKVVCGTTSGVLNIYSWGYWNDCSDRFPGHPESVTGVVAFDDETVLTGSSDGLIRVLNIQPNKMLGVLGEHSDFDIERLALSTDKQFLASISHDHTLVLWNSGLLVEDDDHPDDDDDDDDNDDDDDERHAKTTNEIGCPIEPDTKRQKYDTKDRQQHDDDENDDDDDDEEGNVRKEQATKKGAHKIPKKSSQQQKSNNFFSDLL